jgi:hypothetical protein
MPGGLLGDRQRVLGQAYPSGPAQSLEYRGDSHYFLLVAELVPAGSIA